MLLTNIRKSNLGVNEMFRKQRILEKITAFAGNNQKILVNEI